jgi:hypothetical protein
MGHAVLVDDRSLAWLGTACYGERCTPTLDALRRNLFHALTQALSTRVPGSGRTFQDENQTYQSTAGGKPLGSSAT